MVCALGVPLQPGTSSRRTTMKVAWSLPLLGAAGKVRSAKMVGAEVVPSLIRHAYLSHLCDECPGPQSNSPFRNGVAGEIRQNTHRAKKRIGHGQSDDDRHRSCRHHPVPQFNIPPMCNGVRNGYQEPQCNCEGTDGSEDSKAGINMP